jgi:hypothetical protein
MTLPSGTTIAVSQVRDEFGMGNPVSFSQLRGKGAAPGAGPVSLSNLWGAASVSFSPPGNDVGNSGTGLAQITLSCNRDAVWTWSANAPASFSASLGSGGTASSITFAVSSNVNADRVATIDVTATVNGISKSWHVTLTAYGNGNN